MSSRGWRGVVLSSDRGATSKLMTEAETEQKAEKKTSSRRERRKEGRH